MVAPRARDYDRCMRSLCLACCLTACGVADFDVDQPIPSQTIMGSSLPGPLAALFPIPLNLNVSQQIAAMDAGPIDSVTLKSLELDITAPATADWSFVTEIDVFVSSTKSGTTLPKVKVAHVTSPGKIQKMSFVIEPGVNLKPYVDEGSSVEGDSTGNAPSQDVTFDGASAIHVHPL